MAEPVEFVPRRTLDWEHFYPSLGRSISDSIGALLRVLADGRAPDALDPPVVLCRREPRPYEADLARFAIMAVADNVDVGRLNDIMKYGARLAVCAQRADGSYTVGVAPDRDRLGNYNGRPAVAVRTYPERDRPSLHFIALLRGIGTLAEKLERLPTVGIEPFGRNAGGEAPIVYAASEADVYLRFGRDIPIVEAPA